MATSRFIELEKNFFLLSTRFSYHDKYFYEDFITTHYRAGCEAVLSFVFCESFMQSRKVWREIRRSLIRFVDIFIRIRNSLSAY